MTTHGSNRTQVKEGQRVHTHSPAVVENVRFVLQLLRAKARGVMRVLSYLLLMNT